MPGTGGNVCHLAGGIIEIPGKFSTRNPIRSRENDSKHRHS